MTKNKMDLSSDQDLSIAVMNLISIEEHLFFTAEKTDKHTYYDILKEVREMRKHLLKKLIIESEGEIWCISKHLLSSSMRLMEVGTKQLGQGYTEEAQDMFQKSYDLYSLFWGIQLSQTEIQNETKTAVHEKKEPTSSPEAHQDPKYPMTDTSSSSHHQKQKASSSTRNTSSRGLMGQFGVMVKNAVDCCIE